MKGVCVCDFFPTTTQLQEVTPRLIQPRQSLILEYQMQPLTLVLGKSEDYLYPCGKTMIAAIRNRFNIRQDFISHPIFQRGCWSQAKIPHSVRVQFSTGRPTPTQVLSSLISRMLILLFSQWGGGIISSFLVTLWPAKEVCEQKEVLQPWEISGN